MRGGKKSSVERKQKLNRPGNTEAHLADDDHDSSGWGVCLLLGSTGEEAMGLDGLVL